MNQEVSTERFLLVDVEDPTLIPTICERRKKKGWKLLTIFSEADIQWGSFLSLTRFSNTFYLLFEKESRKAKS